VSWFVERGHELHAISFYPVTSELPGVIIHVLQSQPGERRRGSGAAGSSSRIPRGVLRLLHGVRYRLAGLGRVVREIDPDVFHGHFIVEHGFYGALTGFHPYVLTAWGSDIFVEPDRDRISRRIASWTLRRADLVTSNNQHMAGRIVSLGAPPGRVEVVTLGAAAFFAERHTESVNVRGRAPDDDLVVLSTRAHEPLYNIDDIIEAFALVRGAPTPPRLVVAHSGSLTSHLRARAQEARIPCEFTGTVGREKLRDLMTNAEVFVSVPSSDGTSVALLQAMAAGALPIVSNLETQREWIEDGVNGLLVPVGNPIALAEALERALSDPDLYQRLVRRAPPTMTA
jgi:glycosyltransferase involved in cell wall biosynthesis